LVFFVVEFLCHYLKGAVRFVEYSLHIEFFQIVHLEVRLVGEHETRVYGQISVHVFDKIEKLLYLSMREGKLKKVVTVLCGCFKVAKLAPKKKKKKRRKQTNLNG
jgi:hypothetical protein